MTPPNDDRDELVLLMRAARRVPPMDADEERRLALELRRLRRQYLQAILGFAPARERLRRRLKSDLDPNLLPTSGEAAVESLLATDPGCRTAHGVVGTIESASEPHDPPWLADVQAIRDELERTRTRFATANLRLVVKIAHRFRQPTRVPFLDLVQEGNTGLLDAIDRFEPGRNVRFSTYAVWWIFHRMTRALADHGRLVRIPSNVQAVFHRMRNQREPLREQLGREPTVAEAAQRAGVPVHKATRAHRMMTAEVIGPDASEAAARHVESHIATDHPDPSPPAIVDAHLVAQRLNAELEQLPKREREVISRRFGLDGDEPSTFRDIAADFGVSGERVRQIQNQGLRRLRNRLGEAPLAA